MTRLLIMGAPGAGKGTQAKLIAEHWQIPTISTGAIFRQHMKQGTELGKLAASYYDRGEFIPDEVTDQLVADRLSQSDTANGFLLDGYPRTLSQVNSLDELLQKQNVQLDAVIVLTVDEDAVVERMLKRAEVEDRPDDTEPVIRHRQFVYAQQTQPLIDLYTQRELVVEVDGMGDIEMVFGRIKTALNRFLDR